MKNSLLILILTNILSMSCQGQSKMEEIHKKINGTYAVLIDLSYNPKNPEIFLAGHLILENGSYIFKEEENSTQQTQSFPFANPKKGNYKIEKVENQTSWIARIIFDESNVNSFKDYLIALRDGQMTIEVGYLRSAFINWSIEKISNQTSSDF